MAHDEYKYIPCSCDGAPSSIDRTHSEEYGVSGSLFVICPYHPKYSEYIKMSEHIPISIIDTLCESHFAAHNPITHARAIACKKEDLGFPTEKEWNKATKKTQRRTLSKPQAWAGRHISRKRRRGKRQHGKHTALFPHRDDIIRKVCRAAERRGRTNTEAAANVVLHHLSTSYKHHGNYHLRKLYRT